MRCKWISIYPDNDEETNRKNKSQMQICLQAIEIPGVKIFRYSGSLNFASRQYFREEVYKIAELVPQKELNRRLRAANAGVQVEEIKKVYGV